MLNLDKSDLEIIISALLSKYHDICLTKYLLESNCKDLKEELAKYKSQESEADNNG